MKQLDLNASMDDFEKANRYVLDCAQKAGLSTDSINKLLLATEETFVNIVNYAYDNGIRGTLKISCRSDAEGRFEIQFTDQGKRFNPLEVKNPDISVPIEKRQIGGLGIFLIKNLVDSIDYRRVGDSNVLTLVKRG